MNEKQKNMAEQLKAFKANPEDNPFFDWFCKDTSLARKSKGLFSQAKKFVKLLGIDMTKVYILFKNNCPCGWGGLYDDFRICDLEKEAVIWTVSPRKPDGKGGFVFSVWGQENDFQGPIVEAKTRKEVYDYFKEKLYPAKPKKLQKFSLENLLNAGM